MISLYPQVSPRFMMTTGGALKFVKLQMDTPCMRTYLILRYSHFKPHLVNVNSTLDVSHICPSPDFRRRNQPTSINTSSTIQPPVDKQELLNLIKINKDVLSRKQCDQIHQINIDNFTVFDSNLKPTRNALTCSRRNAKNLRHKENS